MARFGEDFYRDVLYIVDGLKDMQSALQLEVLILKRNERLEVSVTLINRRCQNDVPKYFVRLYHPNFICVLKLHTL